MDTVRDGALEDAYLYAEKLEDRIAELEHELAATLRAKTENDERYMTERDEARARIAELEQLGDAMAEAVEVLASDARISDWQANAWRAFRAGEGSEK